MLRSQRQRVSRRSIAGLIASVIILAILLWAGYAMVQLISGLPGLRPDAWYWIGGFLIVVSFGFGMVVDKFFIRSWDTWIDDLGPTEIAVLVERMQKRQEYLEDCEHAGS